VLAHHHGVDDEGEVKALGQLGHAADHGLAAKRAGLGRCRRDIRDDRLDLAQHELWVQQLDALDSGRVLDGDEGHSAAAIDPELLKGLEVRLQAGSARGVGASDRHRAYVHRGPPRLRTWVPKSEDATHRGGGCTTQSPAAFGPSADRAVAHRAR
jgi:hypothetical protein